MIKYSDKKYFSKTIIGVDEVGRGPLAGPVVACAVLINQYSKKNHQELGSLGVTDSKKITEKKRQKILKELNIDIKKLKAGSVYKRDFFSFSITEISPVEIDKINILAASLKAMKISCKRLLARVQDSSLRILIDGNKTFEMSGKNETKRASFKISLEAIIKGDSKSPVIGLASIIAKEYRDHLMQQLDFDIPGFEFGRHKGYPTARHRELIKVHGVSRVHRKSFRGVKEHL